jgi:Ca2+-binding RTX toxin-like protein
MARQSRSIVVAIALVLLQLGTVSAQQQTTFSTRFGSDPTNVVIGVVDGKVSITEQNARTGECFMWVISQTNRLENYVRFQSGDGNNRIRVVHGPHFQSSGLCNRETRAIGSRSHSLQIFSGNGNDTILASSLVSIWAGGGDDVVLSEGQIAGEGGHDFLIETGSNGLTYEVSGGSGDDWLCDLGDGSKMIGGSNYDRVWNQAQGSREYEEVMSSSNTCNDVGLQVMWTQWF